MKIKKYKVFNYFMMMVNYQSYFIFLFNILIDIVFIIDIIINFCVAYYDFDELLVEFN